MKFKLLAAVAGLALAASASSAFADGELQIYNWGDYTNPDLIKKFEEKYNVKVTITDYDSNDTALAKVRAGGHGFDIVVPSASFVPIWIKDGLLLETRPDQMENFKNMDPKWVDVPFDPNVVTAPRRIHNINDATAMICNFNARSVERLSLDDCNAIDRIAGPLMERLGYELDRQTCAA